MTPAFVVRSADLQPKSVVATGTGLLLAQNMMYRHNVMVFSSDGDEVAPLRAMRRAREKENGR